VACGLLYPSVAWTDPGDRLADPLAMDATLPQETLARMGRNGNTPIRWFLVIKSEQRELLEILHERLKGSGIEVVAERRSRERRRGSLGPLMDRRQSDRRRQRPLAHLSAASVEAPPSATVAVPSRAASSRSREGPFTHPCPTCASVIELELPRFPHPPARVEMEVAHVEVNSRDAQHYVEIAAFTVSGRLILSQRVPGRRSI
jgi:hypothetical protein